VSDYAERLMSIARRLDELAEDGPSELTTISEELGQIAEAWPDPRKNGPEPRWVSEMRHVMERGIQEEMHRRGRYSMHDYQLDAQVMLARYATSTPPSFKIDPGLFVP
jgi:hypothetical protein